RLLAALRAIAARGGLAAVAANRGGIERERHAASAGLTPPAPPSRSLLFLGAVPLPFRGEAVHAGAVVEGLLRRWHVARLPAPCLQRHGLQRAAVAERERPRRARAIHRVQVRGGVFVALPARQEHHAGQRRGDGALQHPQRALRHLLHAGLLRVVLARDTHG